MDAHRFDRISRLFAERRLSRRDAVRTGTAGIAAGALVAVGRSTRAMAQEATPEMAPMRPVSPPEQGPVTKTEYLFVQSFRQGSIAAKTDEGPGEHTITLEQGLGQTIYFSDRPERVVGATPTLDFLRHLGFPDENPPNAALLIETGDGAQEIAVVELFNPHYDPETATATYDVRVLEQWEGGITFAEQPADLAEITPTFGATHLFIDDCASRAISCASSDGEIWLTFDAGMYEFCSYWGIGCFPCIPYADQPYVTAPDSVAGWTALWDDQCTRIGQDYPEQHYCDEGCFVVWDTQEICPPGEFTC
jgi:hypothetical protein